MFEYNVMNSRLALELAKQRKESEGYEGMQIVSIARRFGLIQCMDYMLHIPITLMNRDNVFYQGVKRSIRKEFGQIVKNPYLDTKNRLYLLLFAVAPKFVRMVHSKLKGL